MRWEFSRLSLLRQASAVLMKDNRPGTSPFEVHCLYSICEGHQIVCEQEDYRDLSIKSPLPNTTPANHKSTNGGFQISPRSQVGL
ncbi:hypothetical protein CEXT_269931 [Caerostris extrusa]|uniref:Uncharacterized protein n=1 Tax=Caerostris extrusa TaxID=172846 RepID=A0AAV4P4K6_CAEEX|nr:hypothetical protein CEXT_269931 [Caerostris extrusa]